MDPLNPWSVESLYEFNYFCCPECDTKWHQKQEFINHAFKAHPKAVDTLQSIKDGSMDDITIPEEESETIKTETIEDSDHTKELVFKHKDDLYKALGKKVEDDLDDIKPLLPEIVVSEDDDEEDDFKNESFTCEICDYSAKTPKVLIAHVRNIHHKGKLECPECQEMFKSKEHLRIHMVKFHKIAKSRERCLCTLCGKSLMGKSNLKKHEREKHGIDNAKFIRKDRVVKIQCNKCSTNFETCSDLNEHIQECTGESHKFPCIKCDLKWASGSVLNIHLKIDHKIPEMYTCDKCGKCLKKKVSLISHVKVEHENIKDHVCHLCGRGFARVQGLQFHIKRVHENTGKHFCERCPFKAITKPELDIHINEVHTKAIKFHCDQCSFFCYRKGGLAAHVKNVHLKLRPHRCETCGQAFVRRKELEKHKEWANHS